MNFKQLQYFHQIYQDGSIQKAAANLYVSQQAVSRMLMNLEEELQVELFTRETRGVKPTEWGVMLARSTADILPRMDRIAEGIRKRSLRFGGRVRMGVLLGHLGSGTGLDIGAVESFRTVHPHIELTYLNARPGDMLDLLSQGKLDFVLSTFPGNADPFRCWKLFDYGWRAAMGVDHPLAERESLSMKDLAGQTLIFPRDALHDKRQIQRALPEDNQPVFVDSVGFFYDIICQQLLPLQAIMLCLDHQASLMNPQVIRCVPFETDLLDARIFLICRAENDLSEEARIAIHYLLYYWGYAVPPLDEKPTQFMGSE